MAAKPEKVDFNPCDEAKRVAEEFAKEDSLANVPCSILAISKFTNFWLGLV